MTLKLAQFCDDPPKNIHKIFIPPKNIHFSDTPKNIEIQNFEPKKIARAYVCVKISEYPPGYMPRLIFYFRYLFVLLKIRLLPLLKTVRMKSVLSQENPILLHANKKCANRPAHPHSLLSAFPLRKVLQLTLQHAIFQDTNWPVSYGELVAVVFHGCKFLDVIFHVAIEHVFGVSLQAMLNPVC